MGFAAALAACTPPERAPARSTPVAAPTATTPPAAPPPAPSDPVVVASIPGTIPLGPNDAAPLPSPSSDAAATGPGSSSSCATEAKTPISASLEREERDEVYITRRAAGAKAKACVEPTDEILARAKRLVEMASQPDEELSVEPVGTLGCGTAAGWLLSASFAPKPTFRAGSPDTCPAAAECATPTVSAIWHLPAVGKPRLVPGATDVQEPRDVDGDGELEGIASGARGTTVWFADGTSVTAKATGAWMKVGKDLVLVQGGSEHGFVVSQARAFVVSRAGFVERPELVMPAWESTFAARCPIEPFAAVPPDRINEIDGPSTEVGRPCPQPSEDTRRTVTELILAALAAEARETGLQVTDGPPRFAWGCEQPQLTVLVTYCTGHEAMACFAEHGTWRHEIWIRSPRGMTRATRDESSSEHYEWERGRSQYLVAHADLDGDGALDPIVEDVVGYPNGVSRVYFYYAVARGKVFAFGASDASTMLQSATFPLRLPGAARDLIVTSFQPMSPLRKDESPPEGQGFTVWELGPSKLVRHRGPGVALAKRALAKRSQAQ